MAEPTHISHSVLQRTSVDFYLKDVFIFNVQREKPRLIFTQNAGNVYLTVLLLTLILPGPLSWAVPSPPAAPVTGQQGVIPSTSPLKGTGEDHTLVEMASQC